MCKAERILCICLLALTSCLFMVLFLFFSEKQACNVLEQLSQQEREDLKTFCQHLIKETEFGYTLFGTKPVTLLSPRCSGKIEFNRNRALYDKAIPIIKKIVSKIKIKKYSLLLHDECNLFFVYFVNNEIFTKTLNENKKIFEHLGCREIDPARLLARLSNDVDFEKIVCNNHIALLGICLGYGPQNSLNAERKKEIREYFSRKDIPPWNKSTVALSDDVKKFLRLDQSYSDQWLPLRPCSPPKKISPSAGFSSLEEEIRGLQSALQDSTDQIPDEMSFIKIPLFWCDKRSQETITLLENYKREQKVLREILASEDIVEKIIGKLTEG